MSRPIELLDSQVLSISSKGEMAIREKTEGGAVFRRAQIWFAITPDESDLKENAERVALQVLGVDAQRVGDAPKNKSSEIVL